MEKKAIITANNLSIGYRSGKKETIVHKGLEFSLFRGELTSLLGANGIGKSTLLRTLSASQAVIEGSLFIDGKSIDQINEKEKSRTIGVVLTDKTQAGGLTVYELVALGRQPHTGFFGRLHKKDHDIIKNALYQVGIEHKENSYTAELSDGERQKVMIAKALVQECPLIILDEPTAFLDAVSRIEIMTLLHTLATEQNKAILLSTHDIEQALVLSDRLWLLSEENGLQCGVTEDIIINKSMDALFMHDNIKFDYDHGVYYPIVKGKRDISVKCSDSTLLHWTVNALNRNGFKCIIDNQNKESYYSVYIKNKNDYYLEEREKQIKFNTFESLINYLSTANPE